MAFVLIKGWFVPGAGIPDGDSVRFRARNTRLWAKLDGKPVQIGKGKKTKGTVQLRFEGIDAIEKGAIMPLSTKARDNMLKLIRYEKEIEPEPEGYVLARMTDDRSGRPICFAYAGKTIEHDGSANVYLDPSRLARSVNFKQMANGYAYPLYYNTLLTSLREKFTDALKNARRRKLGYWPSDSTRKGVTVRKTEDLARIAPIWPKLWRRLQEYLKDHNSLDDFIPFLEKKKERVDLLTLMEERGLHDIVTVKGNTVALTEPPENIRVVGKVGRRNRQ